MVPLTLFTSEETRRSPSFSYRKRNWLHRLGWHIKAYAPIIGITVLVGLSLGVLHLHRLLSKLFVRETVKPISMPKEELGVRGIDCQLGCIVKIVSYLAPNWFWFYEAIAAYLSRALAIAIQINQSQFDLLDDPALLHQQLDLAWVCGLPLIRYCRTTASPLRAVVAPVMQTARYQDSPIYFSDVIVRPGNELITFKELAGATLGYNDRGSNSGYYLLFHYLLEQGYSSDFFGKAMASGSHQRSIRWVVEGLVDCAAIDSTVLEQELLNHPELTSQIQIVTSIGPCPVPPLVAAHHLDENWVRKIQLALLEPDAELQTAMQKAGVKRFAIVDLADYEVIGRLYDTVTQANYGAQYAT